MKDPELARGPSFISDLGRTNREERSDGSRHPGHFNRKERSDGSRHPGLLNRQAQRRLPSPGSFQSASAATAPVTGHT